MIKHIDQMLMIWAVTHGGGAKAETGYRSATVLHTLMVEHGIKLPSKRPQSGVVPDDEIAEKMERAVIKLPKVLKIAVLIRYMGGNDDFVGADKMHISHSNYRMHIDKAHHWIAGYLAQFDDEEHNTGSMVPSGGVY